MNPQIKATFLSLSLHAMFVLSALAIGRYTVTDKPPLMMTLSLCQIGSTTAPDPPAIVASQPKTSQPEKKAQPPVATKNERVPAKQVAKIAKKRVPPPPKKTPQAEKKVDHIVQKESSRPNTSAPIVADKDPADSAATSAEATASSVKEPAKPNPQSGGRSGLFSSKELDGSLVVVKQTQPPYPRRARRLNIEGWIKVKFVVDEHGHVAQVTILDAKPEGIFEQSVLQSVDEWRFKPGTIGGRIVKTLVEQTISFKLEG